MSEPAARRTGPRPVQLRVTLIWRGEVMGDQVMSTPGPVTLGASARSTFVIPDLALPPDFAIIRPGNRGYLLTLGEHMGGTVSIDGHKRDVAEFVRRGGEGGDESSGAAGGFRATAIGGRDWGVVDLDDRGHHQLFFQFVPVEAPLPASPTRWEMLIPALMFSLLLHAAMLAVTYKFDEGVNPFVYPGTHRMTGAFLIDRLDPPEPPKPEPKLKSAAPASASEKGQVKNVKSATKGREGRAGGKGDQPRARDPNARDVPPAAPEVAMLDKKNRAVLDNVVAVDLTDPLTKFTGLPGPRQRGTTGHGKGSGHGFGDDQDGSGNTRGSKGNGPGGGGSVEGDFTSQGRINTGETRAPKGKGGSGSGPKEVAVVGQGTASGDFGGLTRAEIDRVVRSRLGLIRACYQKELDRTRGLGGQVAIRFTISPEGSVTKAKVDSSRSTLRNSSVHDCVVRQISKLRFPAKGGGVVNYPFNFSQGA